MSNNNQENTHNMLSLLETYSIWEISDLFSGIDKIIVFLHQVSSEDFLRLNRDPLKRDPIVNCRFLLPSYP